MPMTLTLHRFGFADHFPNSMSLLAISFSLSQILSIKFHLCTSSVFRQNSSQILGLVFHLVSLFWFSSFAYSPLIVDRASVSCLLLKFFTSLYLSPYRHFHSYPWPIVRQSLLFLFICASYNSTPISICLSPLYQSTNFFISINHNPPTSFPVDKAIHPFSFNSPLNLHFSLHLTILLSFPLNTLPDGWMNAL